MRNHKHSAEPLQIDIGGTNIMMRGHDDLARLLQLGFNRLVGNRKQCLLSAGGARID